MKRIIKGENALKTKAPEIAVEWDYEKNQGAPEEYTWKSNASVFWKCHKCGHKYKAKISNRTIGRGCPCCAGKIAVPGINDLVTTHPQLAAEWHPTKNGDLVPEAVTFGRAKKVWWRCPKGHEYQATVNHRSSGTNCPICNSGRQTSFAEQATFYYIKKAFPDAISRYKEIFKNGMELDIYIPSKKLAIEYDGEAWHKADKLEREIKKYKVCQENGIKLLRLKEKMTDETRYTADECLGLEGNMYEHNQLEKVIRFLLDKIDPETNMWTRKNPLAFHSPVDINIKRDEMEIRSYMTDIKSGSLGELFPEIAKEWHPTKNGTLTPFEVFPYSDIKAYWKCPNCQKEYQATIGHRSSGTGCPKCGIEKSALAKSKKVQMIDLESQTIIRTFSSITQASKEMNISSGNISAVCRGGGRKQAGGYFWRYCDTSQEDE
jgi:Zn finger protein HypA/HybF involved in hydrogenase expression